MSGAEITLGGPLNLPLEPAGGLRLYIPSSSLLVLPDSSYLNDLIFVLGVIFKTQVLCVIAKNQSCSLISPRNEMFKLN